MSSYLRCERGVCSSYQRALVAGFGRSAVLGLRLRRNGRTVRPCISAGTGGTGGNCRAVVDYGWSVRVETGEGECPATQPVLGEACDSAAVQKAARSYDPTVCYRQFGTNQL